MTENQAFAVILQPLSALVYRNMQIGGLPNGLQQFNTASTIKDSQKMFEKALKATNNKLPAIEQAMQDTLSGSDMTVYAMQL